MSVISEILKASEARLQQRMKLRPLAEVKAAAADAPRASAPFRDELARMRFGVIAEIKRRSPSTGSMDPSNVDRALEVYGSCPAVSAISILTNQDHFGNALADLQEARKRTSKPLLRKDFILHAYQVWEARAAGADAILLMAGLLDDAAKAKDLFDLARSLGMDALFEIGMGARPIDQQVKLVPAAAEIWGINSRRFSSSRLRLRATLGKLIGKDFWTNRGRHRDLLRFLPPGKLAVAESGIHVPGDLRELAQLGYRAALIGTAFLRPGADVQAAVSAFAAEVAAIRAAHPSPIAAHASG